VIPGATSINPPYSGESAFIAKYDPDGDLAWVHQFKSSLERSADGDAIAVDAEGNPYVSGQAELAPGGTSATTRIFTARFDDTGSLIWMQDLTTGEPGNLDLGFGLAISGSDGVYVTGLTTGTLPRSPDVAVPGSFTAFLAKYDQFGAFQWVRENAQVAEG